MKAIPKKSIATRLTIIYPPPCSCIHLFLIQIFVLFHNSSDNFYYFNFFHILPLLSFTGRAPVNHSSPSLDLSIDSLLHLSSCSSIYNNPCVFPAGHSYDSYYTITAVHTGVAYKQYAFEGQIWTHSPSDQF